MRRSLLRKQALKTRRAWKNLKAHHKSRKPNLKDPKRKEENCKKAPDILFSLMPLRSARESDLKRQCQSVSYDIFTISLPLPKMLQNSKHTQPPTSNPQPHIRALLIIVTKHPPFLFSLSPNDNVRLAWYWKCRWWVPTLPTMLTLQLSKPFFKLSLLISFLPPGFLHIYYSESLSTLSIPLSPLRFCCKSEANNIVTYTTKRIPENK